MAKFNMKRGVSVKRVVKRITSSIILLYVGGTIITEIGNVVNGTTSPFYVGLKLIGWTVDANGTVTDTTGSGILAVIGIVAIAGVVLEFIEFSF